MNESASEVISKQKRFAAKFPDMSNITELEKKSRPDIAKYGFKMSIFEISDKKVDISLTQNNRVADLMLASTASQENFFCKYQLSYR